LLRFGITNYFNKRFSKDLLLFYSWSTYKQHNKTLSNSPAVCNCSLFKVVTQSVKSETPALQCYKHKQTTNINKQQT